MTLDEIVAAMSKAGIASSRTAVWRFGRAVSCCARRDKHQNSPLVMETPR